MNVRYTQTEKPVNWQSANYRVFDRATLDGMRYFVTLSGWTVFESNSIDYCFGYIGRQFPKF